VLQQGDCADASVCEVDGVCTATSTVRSGWFAQLSIALSSTPKSFFGNESVRTRNAAVSLHVTA
jgi:hypothetical protein